MASLDKMFKSLKNEHILGIVGLIVLVFALFRYSQNKNLFQAGMSAYNPTAKPASVAQSAPVVGASTSTTYAPFNGQQGANVSNSATPPAALNKPASNPADLLPSDSNSAWSSMNPGSDFKNVSLLNPTQLVGINTQGSSLRNANLQVRSEPANPRMNTNCPWNISTIEEDKLRKPLEIGASV
tara:strand:- start:2008 stop:2556 length:549 start_codon:yes stop_codon:yes gene_type:complete